VHIVLEGQLGERRALHVRDAERVERDVDAAGLRRDGIGMKIDGAFVHRVEQRDLGRAARREYIGGDVFELGERASGEEHPRPLPGKGAGNHAADGASPP
jgi:hypothetical protein